MRPDELKRHRQTLGLTQETLCDAVAFVQRPSPWAVAAWEQGTRHIPPWMDFAVKQLVAKNKNPAEA